MNLYLLTQEAVTGYDTYDSAVVCAESPSAACLIHPGGGGQSYGRAFDWPTDPGRVTAKYLGPADPSVEPGVVCASFNAG